MKNKIIVYILSFVLTTPFVVNAKIFKCTTAGKTIYQNRPCSVETLQEKNEPSVFDGWIFGMSILAMKQRAEKEQLPMNSGNYALISKFNGKIIESQPKQRVYTYRTTLMDKLTTVTLFFTKTTKVLYQIKATFHVLQLKPEERKYFYESLYSQLSNKYGKSKNIRTDLVKNTARKSLSGFFTRGIGDILIGTLLAWGTKTDNIVTLSYKKNYQAMTSYQLIYKKMSLVKQNENEITSEVKQRTDQSILKDSGRL
ncbi:MAG: hypothetical protein V8K32_09395 [Candidatus Electrothrix gigas]